MLSLPKLIRSFLFEEDMKSKSKDRKNRMTGLREICASLAAGKGFSLYDVSVDTEGGLKYLRVYIDKPDGITLNDCEDYHRALIPLVEDFPYDYLEVSSPGIDRVLKFEDDIARHIGALVEVRLYEPLSGAKTHRGALAAMGEEVIIRRGSEELRFPEAKVAQVRLVPDLSALDSPDTDGVEIIDESEGG